MAQILETSLLNQLNFQTLIATKAARMRESGRGQLLLEFGVRRAQGIGANAGARAALIGGADFTSNVGVSEVLGYPPKGTHAHSMVQVFIALGGTELDAFRAYAEIYPDDCLLLVDTINTLESGIPNAITVFEELQAERPPPDRHPPRFGRPGVPEHPGRPHARRGRFPGHSHRLSNQLDELVIWQIISEIQQEAGRYGLDPEKLIRRVAYGVGTRLITSAGRSGPGRRLQAGGRSRWRHWIPAIKISENPVKTLNPGHKIAWRLYDRRGKATADLLTRDDEDPAAMNPLVLRHPTEATMYRVLDPKAVSTVEPLLVDVLREGRRVIEMPSIEDIRVQRRADLDRLDAGVKRLINPHIYHVSLSEKLWTSQAGADHRHPERSNQGQLKKKIARAAPAQFLFSACYRLDLNPSSRLMCSSDVPESSYPAAPRSPWPQEAGPWASASPGALSKPEAG